MARFNRTTFALSAGTLAEGDLEVIGVSGTEEISRPYEFHVDFYPRSFEPLSCQDLLSKDALLTFKRPDEAERYVHGIVAQIELLEVAAKRARYRLRIAPKLERLRHHRRCRIFPSMSVPDIVKKVLGDGKVDLRDALSGSYPKRTYTTQYRETDLAFVSRLLESEGIFFFFEHSQSQHVMVLADQASACKPIPGDATVPFHPAGTDATAEEHLWELAQEGRLRTGKVTVRDYDFVRPSLDVTGDTTASGDTFGLEVYDYPTDYFTPGDAKRVSQARADERQVAGDTAHGKGTCQRFVPGCTFESFGHPQAELDKSYLLLRVEHSGRQQAVLGDVEAIEDSYVNRFVGRDASLPYRPRRSTARPVVPGPQTATVVGASGEEIHPEQHCRVKVQFHWDREGKNDDHSSCWVRVGQAWAGQGFGANFIPRIGQEVLVRFLEGNPDRPMIGGAVYNGQNPTPIDLPSEKTKSTLRTASSLGSDGFNELRIEDAKGSEELLLHGQKDEKIEVLNDKSQEVRQNEALLVTKDRSLEVDGNQSLNVLLNDASRIEGSHVNADASTEVVGARSVTVSGKQAVSVVAAAFDFVGAASALTIGGAYAVTVGGVLNEAVGGLKSSEVGGAHVEVVGLSREESIEKNLAVRIGGEVELQVKKGMTTVTGKDAKEKIDGSVQIEVKEPVVFMAKSFELKAEKVNIIVGGKLALSLAKSGNKVKYGASSITVDGSGKVKFKGKNIKKESSGSAQSKSLEVKELEDLDDAKKVARASFTGKNGKPAMAGLAFELKLPDGSTKKGSIGKDGSMSVGGVKPGDCKLSFPDLKKG
jgi:type VI secretion system secreted protein VgrG